MILFVAGYFEPRMTGEGIYEILSESREWMFLRADLRKEASLQYFFRGFNPFDT
jgi:hypothetical protein